MLEVFGFLLGQDATAVSRIAGAVAVAFVLFVGVTLAVALFHPDEARRKRAHGILRDLLAVFKGRRR